MKFSIIVLMMLFGAASHAMAWKCLEPKWEGMPQNLMLTIQDLTYPPTIEVSIPTNSFGIGDYVAEPSRLNHSVQFKVVIQSNRSPYKHLMFKVLIPTEKDKFLTDIRSYGIYSDGREKLIGLTENHECSRID